MARQCVLTGQEGFEKSLEYQDKVAIPSPDSLKPHEVLVRLHAASLNYRELIIAGPVVSQRRGRNNLSPLLRSKN
jgi:NADPH:quinone reductase-like Zn-dependent oxidoreductase